MAFAFTAVLIDYDEELFIPPAWIGGELLRSGVEWVEGQRRTPELALAVACAADVVLVQSVRFWVYD